MQAKIHVQPAQGTLDWLRLHVGRPTASEFDNLLTPDFKARTGEMPKTYLCKKVAEAFRNEPLPAFGSWQTDEGLIREEEAIPWYEFAHSCDIQRVGFVESADGKCGCSPDGLLGDDGGIEVKCPQAHTHVSYLLAGTLPKEYATQVHGSLYVTGRQYWVFLSYRRKFPPLVVRVERDEEIMAKIESALTGFYDLFDGAMAKLRSLENAP